MRQNLDYLTTYLNDHLAGSVTIIDLLEHLQQSKAGQELQGFLAELRQEVIEDRLTLEELMQRAHVGKHRHRAATAWLAEKLSRVKLRLDDQGNGALYLLEALELVEVGIEGKRALWRSLSVAAQQVPALQGTNYDQLIRRAGDQHDRVEGVRVEVAKSALVAA
jgi:hypothetical protein